MNAETRACLQASGEVNGAGKFEVLAITEGEGNRWKFSGEVLQESLALWNGVECFVDHALMNRSVRDLAGTFQGAGWDETRRGITATLWTAGPAAGG
jgi:hypothetical protein